MRQTKGDDHEADVTENVSLDGVMQGLVGREDTAEDSSAAAGRSLVDEEVGAFLERSTRAPTRSCSDGGRTRSSPAPGHMKDPSQSAIGRALNSRRKYVASSTLTEPGWADTTIIAGEVSAISELKALPGSELQVHGSGSLVRWLLENAARRRDHPADYPVVIGQGTRLFAESGPEQGSIWSTPGRRRTG